jgi:hypothetical protein
LVRLRSNSWIIEVEDLLAGFRLPEKATHWRPSEGGWLVCFPWMVQTGDYKMTGDQTLIPGVTVPTPSPDTSAPF